MKRINYIIALAVAAVGARLMIVPTAQAAVACVDAVTAGGWVEDGADVSANFGLNAKEEDGVLTGQLNFVNAEMGCHVVGDEVLSYSGADSCRTIEYAVTVNGVVGFTALVTLCDTGERPGTDFFSISVTNDETGEIVETCSASGMLANGDVQIHVRGCP